MQYFLQQLFNALMTGSVYALVAVGFTLVFGTLKVVNMSHPEVCMVGAFVGLFVMTTLHGNFFLALLLAMVFAALLGIVVNFLAVRTTLKGGAHGPLLATMGVSIILQNVVARIAGSNPVSLPAFMGQRATTIGPFVFSAASLIGLVVAVVLMVALTLFIWKSKGGMAIRATAENSEISECLGVNTGVIFVVAFAVSSALGGAAGLLIGGTYGFAWAFMGVRFGNIAMISTIIGGLGSVPGAVVASLTVGLIETLTQAYGLGTYREAILYAVLIVVLVSRPAGLFGKTVTME